jgi:hypothetical protein
MIKYETTPRVEWVRQWPGQIILAVDSIHWTNNVE